MWSVKESTDLVSLNSPMKVKAYTGGYRTSGYIILELIYNQSIAQSSL